MRSLPLRLIVVCSLICQSAVVSAAANWKAGTAKALITPKEPLWMAGYAARTHPARGTLQDLFVRVLVLEDAAGRRGVIVCSDLLGIPRSIAANVAAEAKRQFGLSRDQLMLNASHTHCGPVLRDALYDAYPLDQPDKARIDAYSAELEKTILRTIGAALKPMQPVTLAAGSASADFAVNRRNNREPDVPALRARNALRGPIDHSVPVLAVRTLDGTLVAAVFNYACHNTTLALDVWSGDYAGFAATGLEAAHPGMVALFCMGCGADQNPLPRRSVELCRKYGSALAAAVESVLNKRPKPLSPELRTEFQLVSLKLASPPSRGDLQKLAAGRETYITRWAKRQLNERDQKRPDEHTYPYPIEAWMLGDSQLWIALGGEVVVDYGLRLKARYGADAWITAYANDVMAYIPSQRVLHEGGYEGTTSMIVYGFPALRWGEDVEETIISAVERQVVRLKAAR